MFYGSRHITIQDYPCHPVKPVPPELLIVIVNPGEGISLSWTRINQVIKITNKVVYLKKECPQVTLKIKAGCKNVAYKTPVEETRGVTTRDNLAF